MNAKRLLDFDQQSKDQAGKLGEFVNRAIVVSFLPEEAVEYAVRNYFSVQQRCAYLQRA